MTTEVKKIEGLPRELIALRCANELEDGIYANLGIGIPTLISNWIEGRDIILEAEIGMLRTGPLATDEELDQDLINASCQPVTELPGTCYFSDCESFAMIRGGYMDVCVLGALQVSEKGDMAGWNNPQRGFPDNIGNIGGSMDLAFNSKKLFICMEHTTKDGSPKIVKECTYPLTVIKKVNMIFTDLAVIEVVKEGLLLREIAPGLTVEDVQSVTEPTLTIASDLKEIEL